MKKVIFALIAIVVLAGLVIGGLAMSFKKKGIKVYVASVEQHEVVELVKASGEVNARVKVNISSHVIGKIEKIFVVEGQEVKAGQPFLELEKVAFTSARDDWASRFEMAKNEVEQADIDLADNQIKLDRARRLNSEGIFATEQLQAAELALNSARLRMLRAKESVLQAQANLTNAKNDLAKTTLYAPLAGRVVSLPAKEGEVVISGTINNPASVIGTIADLSEVLAEVDVDETEIVKVKLGQPAILHVDALPDREFHGKVVEVGSSGFNRATQPDVTFFLVKLLFEDPDPALLPGMSVRSDIRTAAGSGSPVVPIQAVVQRPPSGHKTALDSGETTDAKDQEISVVFLFDNGKAVQQPVTTGLSDDTHVEIHSGLSAGQQVITGPYRALKDLEDGALVEIRTPTSDKEENEKKAKDSKDKED